MDVCFVITGKLVKENIPDLIACYKDIPHKILSTWEDEDFSLLSLLDANGFRVILNAPKGAANAANFQSVCILRGCTLAKELGFTRCIRSRTDMILHNIPLFLSLLEPYFELNDKLICLSGMSAEHPKLCYYVDFMIAGRTEQLLRFFTPVQEKEDPRCCELFWLEEYIGRPIQSKADVLEAFIFCGETLQGKPVVCEWKGKGWELFQCFIRPTNNFIWYS